MPDTSEDTAAAAALSRIVPDLNTLVDRGERFGTILVDPPWRFTNRTGKVAPEHKRLHRYETMTFDEIAALPVEALAQAKSHLYLWCPNALLHEALNIMKEWGFTYKTNIVWLKTRQDGQPDGRGVGFYFRNVTELLLFGVKGSLRTLAPGRRQVNLICSRKREHSRKPYEVYDIIEECSPDPYLELFARERILSSRWTQSRWTQCGDEIETYMLNPKVFPGYNGNGRTIETGQLALLQNGIPPVRSKNS
jgi:N6-adenosine-specific RNA methylase IME4